MENKNDIYIGPKSRPHTCPVCMRTKENAIAEQLQAGTSCGHEQCQFKSEIELVSAILNAPNLEQLKSITPESIETSKKTYDLLVNLRQSVKGMKDSLRNEMGKDESVTGKIGSTNVDDDENRRTNISQDQLQSITNSIALSIRTMSKIIEKMNNPQPSVSLPQTQKSDKGHKFIEYKNEEEIHEYFSQWKKRLKTQKEKWDEYLLYRKDYNQRLDEAFDKAHESITGMREAAGLEDYSPNETKNIKTTQWSTKLKNKIFRFFT